VNERKVYLSNQVHLHLRSEKIYKAQTKPVIQSTRGSVAGLLCDSKNLMVLNLTLAMNSTSKITLHHIVDLLQCNHSASNAVNNYLQHRKMEIKTCTTGLPERAPKAQLMMHNNTAATTRILQQ
jgi:hypothetical protein